MADYEPLHLEFGETPLVMPVIHMIDKDQAMRNAELSAKEEVDGVWIIDHGSFDIYRLHVAQARIKAEFPNLWCGINHLSKSAQGTYKLLATNDYPVDGVWADDANIREALPDVEQIEARELDKWRRDHKQMDIIYFGGVAHKATPSHTEDPEAAAELAYAAMPFMDVVTTSGPGTNLSANPAKIKAMSERLGPRLPLALASGVSAENVDNYKEYTDAFLVASSIEEEFGKISATALRGLIKAVRG